ncbi:MAG TPA: DUF2007 domain-containing protein [Gammaproteobacteria bacterium]
MTTYPTRVEADLDRIALEAEGVPCVVVGLGTVWEGGIEGVQLLVPEDQLERARRILDRDPPDCMDSQIADP